MLERYVDTRQSVLRDIVKLRAKRESKVKIRPLGKVCNGLAHHHPPTHHTIKVIIKVRLGSGEGQMVVRLSGECQVNVR